MPPRTVALIGAVCLTIGWLLAATLTPPVARVQSLTERQQAFDQTEPPPFTESLQKRLRHVPEPPASRRNPFTFESTVRREAPRVARPPMMAPDVAPQPAADRPALSLEGIGIAGGEHSAVLSDGEVVQIARIDDVVSGYRIVAISDDSVTVVAVDGERHVLRLR